MRSICFADRSLAVCCMLTLLLSSGCAEGGLDDAELGVDTHTKSTSDAGRRAHDAGASADQRADSIGSGRDAGRSTSSTSSASSASSSGKDGGSSAASASAITCPSPMVCNSTLAAVLSALDSTIKADQSLCVESGGLLPMAVSCSTVDECKSARLTTSTCSGGYCIQPCKP